MKEPRGIDLLRLLVDLLADQEGVKITYELEGKNENDVLDDRHCE